MVRLVQCLLGMHTTLLSSPSTAYKPGKLEKRLEIQGHPQLCNEFDASLGYIRSFLTWRRRREVGREKTYYYSDKIMKEIALLKNHSIM